MGAGGHEVLVHNTSGRATDITVDRGDQVWAERITGYMHLGSSGTTERLWQVQAGNATDGAIDLRVGVQQHAGGWRVVVTGMVVAP